MQAASSAARQAAPTDLAVNAEEKDAEKHEKGRETVVNAEEKVADEPTDEADSEVSALSTGGTETSSLCLAAKPCLPTREDAVRPSSF